jgi:predicted nucleic acid-binding protein
MPTPPLADRIAALPADAQAEVAALVDAFERRTRAGAPRPVAGTPVDDLSFVGMGSTATAWPTAPHGSAVCAGRRGAVADLVLFDTDVLIDAGRGVREARHVLETARARGMVALRAVSEMELIVGCRNKRELAALMTSLQAFVSVPVDARISRQAVALLRTYRLSHGFLIPGALRPSSSTP